MRRGRRGSACGRGSRPSERLSQRAPGRNSAPRSASCFPEESRAEPVDSAAQSRLAPRGWRATLFRRSPGSSIAGAPMRASASLTAFITAQIAPSVPASPTPLTPNGLRSVNEWLLPSVEVAEIVGPRHAVILERARQQLAAVGVVGDVFHQHLADALDDAAMDLPLAQQRVQHRADIVDRDIAGELHLAGLGVDLDLGEMRAARKGRRAVRAEIGALGEPGLDLVRAIARRGTSAWPPRRCRPRGRCRR